MRRQAFRMSASSERASKTNRRKLTRARRIDGDRRSPPNEQDGGVRRGEPGGGFRAARSREFLRMAKPSRTGHRGPRARARRGATGRVRARARATTDASARLSRRVADKPPPSSRHRRWFRARARGRARVRGARTSTGRAAIVREEAFRSDRRRRIVPPDRLVAAPWRRSSRHRHRHRVWRRVSRIASRAGKRRARARRAPTRRPKKG